MGLAFILWSIFKSENLNKIIPSKHQRSPLLQLQDAFGHEWVRHIFEIYLQAERLYISLIKRQNCGRIIFKKVEFIYEIVWSMMLLEILISLHIFPLHPALWRFCRL